MTVKELRQILGTKYNLTDNELLEMHKDLSLCEEAYEKEIEKLKENIINALNIYYKNVESRREVETIEEKKNHIFGILLAINNIKENIENGYYLESKGDK